jgi:anti-sigma-K factor RskA
MNDHAQYAEMLALYALGVLDSAPDRADLESHLRSCVECQSELEKLRGDAALLALSAIGPAPPQAARQRLLAAIANEPRKRPVRERMVLGVLHRRWLTFAPIAATLLLAVFSLLLWRTNARLMGKLERTQAQLEQANQQLHEAQQLVALLKSPDTVHVTLVSAKTPPQPQAKAIYGPKMGRLLLMANNMEPLPPNKVYQLWLLPMSGAAPMSAGTFKPNEKGAVMMDHSMESGGIEAKGFAITIEPEGGSQTPTMPIKMVGEGI